MPTTGTLSFHTEVIPCTATVNFAVTSETSPGSISIKNKAHFQINHKLSANPFAKIIKSLELRFPWILSWKNLLKTRKPLLPSSTHRLFTSVIENLLLTGCMNLPKNLEFRRKLFTIPLTCLTPIF